MKKQWLGVLGLMLATAAVAEQNPPLPPVPPAGQTGPLRSDGHRHEPQVFAMRFGGGDESARILPPGAWWKDAELAKRIELTPDQQKRIEDTFLQSRIDLIHLHAGLEEQELLLQPMLNAQPLDQGKVLAQIGKIADMRADLEKANAKMLLGIRGVLNQQQWTRLQQERPGGMRHMMIRTPDGPHSLFHEMPELEGLQLEAAPLVDAARLHAELQAALGAMPAIDAGKLRVQLQSGLAAMPMVDAARLRAEVQASLAAMPAINVEALRGQLRSLDPVRPMTPDAPLEPLAPK